MVGMFVIGIPLEMTNGSFIVSLIYFLGVLGGSLASGVLDPGVGLVGKTFSMMIIISTGVYPKIR